MGIFYSFTDWSRFSSEIHFVGLEHYRSMLGSNRAFWQAIKNTLVFTCVTIVSKTVLGLALAMLVSRGIRRLSTLHRAVITCRQFCP